jgi:hypothetical protein
LLRKYPILYVDLVILTSKLPSPETKPAIQLVRWRDLLFIFTPLWPSLAFAKPRAKVASLRAKVAFY